MKLLMNKPLCKAAAALATAFLSVPAFAQSVVGVQVYDLCNFDGDSAVVEQGEYRSMRDIDFSNDRISAIRVPNGFEVRIYEDDDFKGDFATIGGDIRCFDSFWNDRVSSIKVFDQRTEQQRQVNRNQRIDNQQTPTVTQSIGRNVRASNVNRVTFDRFVLQQTATTEWRMVDAQGGRSQFSEVSRESNSVLLKNEYSNERLRIDLFTKDITLVQANGQTERFPITSALANSVANRQNRTNRANRAVAEHRSTPKVLRLSNRCVNYRAYTTGGTGGVRVYGLLEFRQFGKTPITGQVCVNGEATLELQKNNQNTDVYFEIAGESFRFAPGEQHDVFKNTWYRRKTQLLYRN